MINKFHDRNKRPALLTLVILSLSIITGCILYSIFGHHIVKALYEGKAGILNGIISGQSIHALPYYTAKANELFINLNILFFILILTILYASYKDRVIETIKKQHNKIFFLFFILYFFYSLAPFALEGDSPFFSTSFVYNPSIYDDYALHYSDAVEGAAFFKDNGRIWGYNPYYHAGYLSGVFLSVDNHWAILFHLIAGNMLNPAFVFNLAIFMSYLILPILAFFTARNFSFTKINSLFFFVLSMFLISGFAMIVSFYRFGGYGYVLGVFLSFYTSSILFRYISGNKHFKTLVLLTFWGSLTFLVHPLTAVMCLSLCVPMVVFYFRETGWVDIVKVSLCIIIILIVNSVWLFPYFITFSSLRLDLAYLAYLQTHPGLLWVTLKTNASFVFLTILFLLFLYGSYRNKNYRFAGIILFSYLILFIISFFGSQTGLLRLQPMRFIIPLALLCTLAISSRIESELSKTRSYIYIALLMILIGSLISFPQKHVLGYSKYPAAEKILNFIEMSTTGNARIQVQDSQSHVYFWSHFTSYIPLKTSKEILAGTCTFPPSKFAFTQFIDDNLFGESLDNITKETLREYMELYNIKYFLIFSEKAHDFFKGHGRFRQIFNTEWNSDRFKKTFTYYIYEYLDADESYCYKCDADVRADYDEIIVKNAKSTKTVLKYHYIKTLKVKPETLTIKPIMILDDPVPFIIVENGNHDSFYIYND